MKNIKKIKATNSSRRTIKDFRLWLGIFFVFISVISAQLVLAKATARTSAILLKNSVPAGSLISENDVMNVKVVLPSEVNAVTDRSQAVGYVAARDLFAGDVLISQALSKQMPTNLRMVSVPIKAGHLPAIESGQLVDVWVTPAVDAMALPGPARLVITQATVHDVPAGIDPALDTAVTLLIESIDVQEIVQAMRDGVIDLVALPDNRRSN